jgi:hypothetical protein
MKPRQVKAILIARSQVQPLSKKTPRGGKMIANRTLCEYAIVYRYAEHLFIVLTSDDFTDI